MSRVAVVTDSNSGITQLEAEKLGIRVLPMPFYIDGELFYEDISMSQEQFYEALARDADISTSQPSPAAVTELWDSILAGYDALVYIPMSSGLSSSCESAKGLAEDKRFAGRVFVVDNRRISVTQRQSVFDAITLAGKGVPAAEIAKRLEETSADSTIYITVETLKYLKKGGRITPVAAAVGTLLKIKPVLQIQGAKLDAYSKVVGKKSARKTMISAMRRDMEGKLKEFADGGKLALEIAYSGNVEEAEDWRRECEQAFPGYEFAFCPLSLSVSCHIGYGALALAAARILD